LTCDIEGPFIQRVAASRQYLSPRRELKLTARKKIRGDAEADRMLTRDYRKPYVVPEKM
jgi:hypothetical protein